MPGFVSVEWAAAEEKLVQIVACAFAVASPAVKQRGPPNTTPCPAMFTFVVQMYTGCTEVHVLLAQSTCVTCYYRIVVQSGGLGHRRCVALCRELLYTAGYTARCW
jgi:hypothetical protein